MRTSVSHPLQIAAVVSGVPGHGRVGLTFCPGKHDPFAVSGGWDRDLARDLDTVRDWGAVAVVTLLEPKELTLLRAERLGEEVRRRNMLWFHLPIVDVSIPDERFEQEWDIAGDKLCSMVRRGLDVLVHCRGGLGRAGTVAARLLVELGMEPTKAIASDQAVRPGAIQTGDQARYVLGIGTARESRQGRSMDWFERLVGFHETSYDDTRAKLRVEGTRLQSLINGKSYGIGNLDLVPLSVLRERVKSAGSLAGRLKVSVATGDVRNMHQLPGNVGALFQVASQFNLLEMVGPTVTPEHGVTGYQNDHTQGPACAIAAGAATIYRNYFAPVGGAHGQTAERQLNGLADLGVTLAGALNRPVEALWEMQNGYALCSHTGLEAIADHIRVLLSAYARIEDAAQDESLSPEGRLADQVFRLHARLCVDGCRACVHQSSDLMTESLAEASTSRTLLSRFMCTV
jgi:protein-tyrosine phosphatase